MNALVGRALGICGGNAVQTGGSISGAAARNDRLNNVGVGNGGREGELVDRINTGQRKLVRNDANRNGKSLRHRRSETRTESRTHGILNYLVGVSTWVQGVHGESGRVSNGTVECESHLQCSFAVVNVRFDCRARSDVFGQGKLDAQKVLDDQSGRRPSCRVIRLGSGGVFVKGDSKGGGTSCDSAHAGNTRCRRSIDEIRPSFAETGKSRISIHVSKTSTCDGPR
mmetsp:Transcript_40307/g.96669  ORF Transcript_40307/g.96669 Transcript_40307/m.96669 type:complete len:226 (-) Transcript_40307:355-1032(-)